MRSGIFVILLTILSFAHSAEWGRADASAHSVSAEHFETEIANRLSRVEEFRLIQSEAQKLGVRAWLFGGTAAGYAHYVKWDLQREAGDPRFQPNRFDYDYTNIYRSTQDLDIVIDGNAQQAERLERVLSEKYPHLQGSKSAWEVRTLTERRGDKEAIVGNRGFLDQHNDSNSTGLIELTHGTGEPVIRDALQWEAKTSEATHFFDDVYHGKLHYYFNPLHFSTARYREGLNPPILSAIRYLTKAFQYDLAIQPEDLAKIQKVIEDFNPKKLGNPYVLNWLNRNGKKLLQHSVDLEYAVKTLDELGLRQKLRSMGNVDEEDSLAWWMNKEPLKSAPVGEGFGKTAKELGIDVVAHETNNFQAYESITRAHTGEPNVLISRNGLAGETAAHGDGFYTRVGTQGARGTGLTVRFTLDPKARKGSDFTRSGDFVIVHNKEAIRVIPESLNFGAVEYFRWIADGNHLSEDDRGIAEKLTRRMGKKLKNLSSEEADKITKFVIQQIHDRFYDSKTALSEWLKLGLAPQHPEVFRELKETALKLRTPFHPPLNLEQDFSRLEAIGKSRSLPGSALGSGEPAEKILDRILAKVEPDNPALLKWLETPQPDAQEIASKLVLKTLTQEEAYHPPRKDTEYLELLSQDVWAKNPAGAELVKKAIQANRGQRVAHYVLSEPSWIANPHAVELANEMLDVDPRYVHYLGIYSLGNDQWLNQPGFESLAKRALTIVGTSSRPNWGPFERVIPVLAKKWDVVELVTELRKTEPKVAKTLEGLLAHRFPKLVADNPKGLLILQSIYDMNFWGKEDSGYQTEALVEYGWNKNPELLKLCKGKVTFECLSKEFNKKGLVYREMENGIEATYPPPSRVTRCRLALKAFLSRLF